MAMLGVKDPIGGVVDRGGIPSSGSYDPPLVKSYVYSYSGHDGVYWSELQPSSGAALDATVMADLVGELDAATGAGYTGGIKLRVLCGINSPTWLKTLVGTFKCDTTPTGGAASEADCPLWMLPAYTAAYDDLMRLLAAQLDAHPALRDVAITADGLHFGEPYVRKINQNLTSTGNATKVNIWNGFYAARSTSGFVDDDGRPWVTTGSPSTDPYHGKTLERVAGDGWHKTDRHYGLQYADIASMRAAIATHNRWWARTRSSLAVNPYQQILHNDDSTINGTVENTPADLERPYKTWTLRSMVEARELMTQRVVLGNNSVRYTSARTATGSDTFERSDTSYGSGWGTASGGGTYTSADVTDVRVDSGYGQMRQDSVGDRRMRHTATATGDSEVLIGIAWSAHAAGAAHHVSTELCVQNVSGTADGFYEIELEELTSGVVRIRWRKNDSTVGSTTALPAASAINYTITSAYVLGQTVWVRAQVEAFSEDEVTLRARGWVDGDPEPAGWQIEITDTSPNLVNFAGHFGIRANAGTGYTATSNVWSIVSWAVAPIGTPTLTASVGGPSASAKYERIYQTQAEMGGPTYYQTAAPAKLPHANWQNVLDWASTDTTASTSLGQHGQQATYVELPSSYDGDGGYSAFNTTTLAAYDTTLAAAWPPSDMPAVLAYTDAAVPELQVLIGFRHNPNDPPAARWTVGDATYGQVGNWPLGGLNELRDITADVMKVSTRRGFDRETGAPEPGQATIRVRNLDRSYDPANPASPWYGGIWPNIPVQIQAVFDGATVPIWTGYVDEWTCDYDMPIEGIVDIKCSDILKLAALAEVPEDKEEPGEGDTSTGRVDRLLEKSRFEIADFDRDTVELVSTPAGGPTVTLQKSKFGGKLLEHLRKIVEAERGVMAVHADGIIRFGGRYQLAGDPRSRYAQVLFGDETGEVPYSAIDVDFTDREVLTEVVVTRDGASQDDDARQTATNESAETQSGLRVKVSKSLTAPFDRDTLSLGLAEFVLRQAATPGLYVDSIKVIPRNGQQWAAVLARELGDRISVRRRPRHAGGSMLHVDSHLTEISHDIAPGNKWDVTFGMSPAPPSDDVWIVGDVTAGIVGSAKLG